MEPARLDHFRIELQRRRTRLIHRLSSAAESSDLVALLRDVDAALDRIDHSTFGHCEVCRGTVEESDLDAHPLLTWCLCSLSQPQRQWLQRDLDLATRVQRALLPAPDLRVDGWWIDHRYLPVGPVSGDYCDAMTSSDDVGSLYFLLGDVSGKGVAAALMMARLSALFRSLVPMRPTLSEMISRANALLTEGPDTSQYVTLVAGRACRGGAVEIANAGHVRPLLLTGERIDTLDQAGKPLGLFADADVPSTCLTMTPGDTLFLYTDGLVEAEHANGEPYGNHRLQQLLQTHRGASPGELIDAALADQFAFRAGSPASDDISVMAIRAT